MKIALTYFDTELGRQHEKKKKNSEAKNARDSIKKELESPLWSYIITYVLQYSKWHLA